MYNDGENIDVRLTGAWQESQAHRIWYDNGVTPFTQNRSQTRHWDLWAQGYGLDFQVTSISGIKS